MILDTYKLKHGNDNSLYFIQSINLTGDIMVVEFGIKHFNSKKIAYRNIQEFIKAMEYHDSMIVVSGE